MRDYAEIFELRGREYHAAMELCPRARDPEFRALLSRAELAEGQRIVDVPAGGGYLEPYLREELVEYAYRALETSETFARLAGCDVCTLDALPLEDASVEVIFCMAALHHVGKREPFYRECLRVLVPGGQLVIGDVLEGSLPAGFLNGFVDRQCNLGHQGSFLSAVREPVLLGDLGFRVRVSQADFAWPFASRGECVRFARFLFGLDRADDAAVWEGLRELSPQTDATGAVRLPWSLGFLHAQTPVR